MRTPMPRTLLHTLLWAGLYGLVLQQPCHAQEISPGFQEKHLTVRREQGNPFMHRDKQTDVDMEAWRREHPEPDPQYSTRVQSELHLKYGKGKADPEERSSERRDERYEGRAMYNWEEEK